MKRSLQLLLVFFIMCLSSINLNAQMNENIWFDGLYRTYFSRDAIEKNTTDTLSAKNISNGYNLLDLNTHVNPIKDIEIFAQLRIRNSFGSFFGSGTEIDVRQLKVKGVINNKVRYSIGDLFLKQTRFTLHNYEEEFSNYTDDILKPYRDIIHYENFYYDNRWRLQGIQTDFSFEFDRFIRSLDFDLFVTRPRGSSQINETDYSSDLILSGGSIVSKINKKLTFSTNYINLFEIASSGTKNISVRNPVHDISILHYFSNENHFFEQKLQTGYSRRYWFNSELENGIADSISYHTKGIYFEFDNKYIKNDSTISFSIGYRYVDPNFRSSGAQTRRLNFFEGNSNTTYPIYTNMSIFRPSSMFDLLSDYQLYNQNLSSTLMDFNPIYSNVLPYGESTPNRTGIYLKARINSKNKLLIAKINSGVFKEVIGQGTSEKRKFGLIIGILKLNLNNSLNWKKELSLITSNESELTNRVGNKISSLNLFSHKLNFSINAELVKNFFIQTSYRQFNANGNEFLTQRDNYGNITNYTLTDVNQKDYVISIGTLYKLRKNLYANIQYNGWGSLFSNQNNLDYKYNKLTLILSVEL